MLLLCNTSAKEKPPKCDIVSRRFLAAKLSTNTDSRLTVTLKVSSLERKKTQNKNKNKHKKKKRKEESCLVANSFSFSLALNRRLLVANYLTRFH